MHMYSVAVAHYVVHSRVRNSRTLTFKGKYRHSAEKCAPHLSQANKRNLIEN